jgi:SSS family solute:Na+ symporter
VSIVLVMVIYSEIGGLKAIMYSDVVQGALLLGVTWLIAHTCVSYFGGLEEMFRSVEVFKPELLSTPGPNGLFTFQFLLASFLALLMVPVTQPQVSIRMIIMRNLPAMQRMAVALGGFAILVILPTVAIGMYGAVKHPDASTADFLVQVLAFEQVGPVAALTMVGLIAAAMSTADSQIFALGTELHYLMHSKGQVRLLKTRLAIIAFALASLVFAILSSDQLVLLARVSFAGTALMGPMVLAGILSRTAPGREILWLTALSLLLFVLSLLGIIPDQLGKMRLDLTLLIVNALVALVSVWARKGFLSTVPAESAGIGQDTTRGM